MPRYDYKCKKCEFTFEAAQNITEEPLATCPECEGKIFRVIGKNIGVQFLKSVIYKKDYSISSITTKNGKSNLWLFPL